MVMEFILGSERLQSCGLSYSRPTLNHPKSEIASGLPAK